MKKILSVLVAVIMTVSVLAISSVTAIAAPSPSGSIVEDATPTLQVNGVSNSTDISYTPSSSDQTTITFEYTGAGELTGWETNLEELGYVDGTDYTITENADGTLTIKFISSDALDDFNSGIVVVNAIVDIDNGGSQAEQNGSNKSPSTGIATSVIAGSVAAAGAGFAVLSATKKRDAE